MTGSVNQFYVVAAIHSLWLYLFLSRRIINFCWVLFYGVYHNSAWPFKTRQ